MHMSGQDNDRNGKTTRQRRAANRKQPKPHVISLRMNDQERELLEQVSRKKAKNVSAVVREALEQWLAREQRMARRAGRHRPAARLAHSCASAAP